MEIGIGLPNPVSGTTGRLLIDWAKRAEARGFSALATIDRIAYPSYESLVTLAAAAAVTERVKLYTNVLLGPTRNPGLLAKEAASVDQLSGGRLVLGVAVGGREDDFVVAEQEFGNRGQRWDAALELMHRAWQGEPVAGSPKPITPPPTHAGGVPLMIGGTADAAIERTVRWGIGWTSGGGGPDMAGAYAAKVRQAWADAGREGSPRIMALAYFALGDQADTAGPAYLRDYYGAAPWVEHLVGSLARTPEAIRDLVVRFEQAGIDELILDPTVADLGQVDLLADVVFAR
jgi:alkanesulfonate monooxygenase SsuD/methylene tetrahydromethanopterin reductase-like flavin-dependent oxidoreductase (luciferase family)